MKFRFISTQIVEANSIQEAKDKFADSSWNFAAKAECYGIKCPECGSFENEIISGLVRCHTCEGQFKTEIIE